MLMTRPVQRGGMVKGPHKNGKAREEMGGRGAGARSCHLAKVRVRGGDAINTNQEIAAHHH
jgi:hypothetical protein